jgi:release factor glutamine methyltransferase
LNEVRPWTILEVLKWTTDYLASKSVPTPRLDAEVLLAYTLKLERVGLYLDYQRPLGPEELARFRELVRRRARREPVAYIRGFKEFWSLVFTVSPEVLIPRPETEVLVEEGIRLARGLERTLGRAPRIADAGTGSGAVAVCMAKELKLKKPVLATDSSRAALSIAGENAQRHGAEVSFILADWLEGMAPASLDLIVSNPPYVPREDIANLAPELGYEPRAALDGGPDGLDFIRLLARQAATVLAPGGMLAIEVGTGQAAEVVKVLAESGFSDIGMVRDLSNIERVVKGKAGA